MSMKQPSDLSPLEVVFARESPSSQVVQCSKFSMGIREVASSEGRVKPESHEQLMEHGCIITAAEFLSNQSSNRAGVNQMRIDTGKAVWRVLNSDASESGWGPFLYDIAMELATLNSASLRSHDMNVSPDAPRSGNTTSLIVPTCRGIGSHTN